MTDKTKYKSVAIDNNCYKNRRTNNRINSMVSSYPEPEVVRFLVNNFKFVEEEKDHLPS